MAAPPASKVYTLADLKAHSTEADCWILVHGKVYDVTAFLDEHPGGFDIIVSNTSALCVEGMVVGRGRRGGASAVRSRVRALRRHFLSAAPPAAVAANARGCWLVTRSLLTRRPGGEPFGGSPRRTFLSPLNRANERTRPPLPRLPRLSRRLCGGG